MLLFFKNMDAKNYGFGGLPIAHWILGGNFKKAVSLYQVTVVSFTSALEIGRPTSNKDVFKNNLKLH